MEASRKPRRKCNHKVVVFHGSEVTSSKPRPNSSLKGAGVAASSHKLNSKLNLSPEEDGSVATKPKRKHSNSPSLLKSVRLRKQLITLCKQTRLTPHIDNPRLIMLPKKQCALPTEINSSVAQNQVKKHPLTKLKLLMKSQFNNPQLRLLKIHLILLSIPSPKLVKTTSR